MVESTETSTSSSTKSASEPKNVIQQPTSRPRAATDLPVDTTQNYDDSNEPAGIGEAGFKKVGDPVTRAPRHRDREA